jgi:hypothetical protein
MMVQKQRFCPKSVFRSLKALPFDYTNMVQTGRGWSLNVWSVELSDLDFPSW